jgi:hypothetical protein
MAYVPEGATGDNNNKKIEPRYISTILFCDEIFCSVAIMKSAVQFKNNRVKVATGRRQSTQQATLKAKSWEQD